ncbi:MAG: DNA helicase RecQ [Bdellovibrionales bacterium]
MSPGLNEQLISNLRTIFGFEGLRLEQENIIQSIMNGKDTLGIMPTGGGKSLCYQLPAVTLDGLAIVISPLISLMEDQVANLNQFGIESAFLNSTLDFSERKQVEARLKNSEIKILFIAPEGILVAQTLAFLRQLNISLIAIDEAHCVSQWGHEFRSDYTRLNELRTFFPKVPFLALTATADTNTRTDIVTQLALIEPSVFVAGFDRPNIQYLVHERLDEISQLERFIRENHEDDTGIVYCLSRKKVEKTAEKLKSLGFNAYAYHAGMTSKQRTRAQKKFKSEDRIIIVATIAFGMGIDRPDVRYVAHLDLPKSIEGYYQETGRAGRDGKPASAWMVYGFSDVVKHIRMLETTDASETYKKVARKKMDAMLDLCEAVTCRRVFLLNYFDGEEHKACGNCDSCLMPPDTWDGTIDAQKALSAVYRTGQMYGANHVIDVLRGSKNAKISSQRHDELSVYNIGSHLSKKEWNSVFRQLLNKGYLFVKDYEYRSLGLTDTAKKVFKNEDKVELRKLRDLKSKPNAKKKSSSSNSEIKAHGREDLFESLRAYRKEIASENSIPPYLVFSDKTLHDMCNLLPENKDAFLMVHGVGQSKLEKYGEGFLGIINA